MFPTPEHLKDFILNKKTASFLETLNYDNLNHILLYGISSVGKRTLIYALIKHLFKQDNLFIHGKQTDIKVNNNNIKINYRKSLYHFEINLYEYGLYDKHVISQFIKELVSYKSVTNKYKIILILNLDKCSQNANLVLRRIIEKQSKNTRFIVTCNNLTKVNEAVRSRFINIRVPFPNENSINEYLNFHKKNTSMDFLKKNHNHNLYVLNSIIFNDLSKNYFDIGKRLHSIVKEPKNIFMDSLRAYIYKLYLINYNYLDIFKIYTKYIISNDKFDDLFKTFIVNKASELEYKSQLSSKFFFCLEKFFLNVRLQLLS